MAIRNLVIYGAGLMGKGIALALSVLDCQITLYDLVQTDVTTWLNENFRPFREHGILTEQEVRARIGRIGFTTDPQDDRIRNADLVIECVFEDMALKQKTFHDLESVCRPDALLCTNTSVMSPTEIGRDLQHPERFVGTHFWNPPYLVPLVEVVKTERSSAETAQAVIDVLNQAGKTAVLCQKDVPGFIANRMQHALWREAIDIVEQGIADARTVDLAVKNSFGLRLPQLPPLENADMVGLDLTFNIHQYLLPHLANSGQPSQLLETARQQGHLGYKTGKGFHVRTPEEIMRQKQDLNEYLIQMLYKKNPSN